MNESRTLPLPEPTPHSGNEQWLYSQKDSSVPIVFQRMVGQNKAEEEKGRAEEPNRNASVREQTHSQEADAELEVLKDCTYTLRYDPVGTTTRTRRVIICGHDNCQKEFVKAWNFLDHFRMHQGVRPFACTYCSKSFTQKGNLKKHMRQHINSDVRDRKVHTCHLCPKAYTERYNLKAHIASKHPGVDIRALFAN